MRRAGGRDVPTGATRFRRVRRAVARRRRPRDGGPGRSVPAGAGGSVARGPRRRGPVSRSARAARRVLRRLSQRPHPDRRPVARPGRRPPDRGRGRDLGEGGAQAAQRRDAAARAAPARRAGPRRLRLGARGRARRGRRRPSEPGPPPRPPPEPVRVRQRGAGPARSGDRRGGAAASRRVGSGLRQHRRGSLDLSDPARPLSLRGPPHQPARGRRPVGGARGRDVPRVARDAAGRADGRGPALRHPRRHRGASLLPARRRVRRQGPPRAQLHQLADTRHRHPRGDRCPARRGADRPAGDRRPVHDPGRRRPRVHGVGHLPHVALPADGRRGARGALRGPGRHAHPRRRVRPQERADRGAAADPAAAPAHQLDLRGAAHGRRLRAAGGAVRPDRPRRHREPAAHLRVPARRGERRGRNRLRAGDPGRARPARLPAAGHRRRRRHADGVLRRRPGRGRLRARQSRRRWPGCWCRRSSCSASSATR